MSKRAREGRVHKNWPTHGRVARWARRLGLGIGTLAGAVWLISVGGGLIEGLLGEHTPFTLEGAALGGLVLFVVTGVLIAWRWEGIGGTVEVIGGIGLSTFAYLTAGSNKVFAMSVSGLPFLISGVLVLIGWRISAGPKPDAVAGKRE